MALSPLPRSLADLESRVVAGLPAEALWATLDQVEPRFGKCWLTSRIAPGLAPGNADTRLSAEVSGRVERLARVYATALYVWNGDADEARSFLHARHPLLEGRTPLNVALSELGARRVETLLGQLYWGVAA